MDRMHVVMETSTIVVVLRDDVDIVSAERLREQLIGAVLDRSGARSLVVDLRQLGFIDSCGLRMFLCLHEMLARAGIESFLVTKSGSAASRLFEITDLEGTLRVHHRLGDALQAAKRCASETAPASPLS